MSVGAFEPIRPTGEQVGPHIPGARLSGGGVMVQHYPRDTEGNLHVQLGRQFREEGVEIDWPDSDKRRIYMQSNTGDKYLIVGNTFQDLSASEAAGEPVYQRLDPNMTFPTDLIGKPQEWLPGHKKVVIEMVEISAGFSDSEGEHLEAYEMAGADPFEKFNRRFERVGGEEWQQAENELESERENERLINDGVLLADFRTYPDSEPEPRGLRARAQRMVAKAGLAGKALAAEVREQVKTDGHEWKYARRRAALAGVIGATALGGIVGLNHIEAGPSSQGKPAGDLAASESATVTPQPGDNPWEISEQQLAKHGVARPNGPEITDYDNLFLATNFPNADNLEQAAEHLKPGKRYVLPVFNFKRFKR